jgi:diguanylate cyclase (GGDEF)-like protein
MDIFLIISLGFLLFDLVLFLTLLLRTVTNMYARGARSLLLVLLILVFMLQFHAGVLLVRNEESRLFMFTFELFFFMLLPVAWAVMTYEMSGIDTKKSWKIGLPMFLVNFLFFGYLQSLRDPGPPAYSYSNCQTVGFFTECDTNFEPITFIFFLLLFLEIIGGVAYLIWYYFRYPNTKDREQFVVLGASIVSIPVITGVIVLIFGPNSISPMPVALAVMAITLFIAVFNYKALTFTSEEQNAVNMVDDLILVVDNDHIVQDFNLSTLRVFGQQVKEMVNVKLEHAFINHPNLIELFQSENVSGEIEFIVDGEAHRFEPTLINVLDPETNEPVGKRLQLHDITKRMDEDTTSISRDRLTNQYTRETFFGLGRRIFANAKRMGQPVALVVLDIDDFQNINSRYTYVVGDEALVQMVDVIHRVIRTSDMMARFDSDNFVLLLNRTTEDVAYQVCSRIKDAVATNIFNYEGQELQFTVSQGYTVYEGGAEVTLEGLYETARAALMTSRGQGRNRLAYREMRRY